MNTLLSCHYLRIAIIFFVFVTAKSLSAQTVVKGVVIDSKTQPVGYATIQSFHLPDSTFIGGCVAEADGSFELVLPAELRLKDVVLRASCLSYITREIIASEHPLTIELSEDTRMLKEVVVTARAKGQQIDHRVFGFSQKLLKAAQNSRDLFRFIPDINVDLISGQISSISKGSVQVLINGIKATDQQLKALPAHFVKEIVYYDIPPARYAGVGAVIDVIAPRLEAGIDLGVNLLAAVSTGFADGSAFINLVKGKHQLSGEYTLSHRNYTKRISDRSYTYDLGGEECNTIMEMQDDFGYTTHQPTIRYTLNMPKVQVLQFSFTPEFETRHNGGITNIIHKRGTNTEENKADVIGKSNYVSPIFDIYYSRQFGEKQELSGTANVAFYSTEATESNHEFRVDKTPVIQDDMQLKNKSRSLSGEINYTNRTSIGQWNTGYRLRNVFVDYNITNMFGNKTYTTTNTRHYFYTELKGRYKKFNYLVSLGLTHLSSDNAGVKYSRTLFTPNIMLASGLGKGHYMRFQFAYTPVMPWASQVSDNSIYLSRDIIHKGNPDLLNAHHYSAKLFYSWENSFLNLSSQLFYTHTEGVHTLDYRLSKDGTRYERSYFNARSLISSGGSLQIALKPFGDILSLRAFVEPACSTLSIGNEKFNHFAVRNNFSLTFIKNKWMAQYVVSIPEWSLSGSGLDRTREIHGLYGQYKTGNWSFILGWSVIGAPTTYNSKAIANSPVRYTANTNIYDNKNMVLLGVSYSFSSGKKQQVSRTLQSESSGAVTF